MIDIKYKKIYDEYIKKYEEIHLDPWHEISKEELDNIYNNLVDDMDINDEYSFLTDSKGSVTKAVDKEGNEIAEVRYGSYGNVEEFDVEEIGYNNENINDA